MGDQSKPSRHALLDDPLIRQMMRADGVSHKELDRLLTEVSMRLKPAETVAESMVVFDLQTIDSRLDPRFSSCRRLLDMQCPKTMH